MGNLNNDDIIDYVKKLQSTISQVHRENKLAYDMLREMKVYNYFRNSCTSQLLEDLRSPMDNEYNKDINYIRTVCNVMAIIRGMDTIKEMHNDEVQHTEGIFIDVDEKPSEMLMHDGQRILELRDVNDKLSCYFKRIEAEYFPEIVLDGDLNENENRKYYDALKDLQQRLIFDEFGITKRLMDGLLFSSSDYNSTINYATELRRLYWYTEGMAQIIDIKGRDNDDKKEKNEQLKQDLVSNKSAIVRIVKDRFLLDTGLVYCNAEFPHNDKQLDANYLIKYIQEHNKEALSNLKLGYKIISGSKKGIDIVDIFNKISKKYNIDFSDNKIGNCATALNETKARLEGLAHTSQDKGTRELCLGIKSLIDTKEKPMEIPYNIDSEQICYNKLIEWNAEHNILSGNLLKKGFIADDISYIAMAKSWYYTLDEMGERVQRGAYSLDNVDMNIVLYDIIDAQNGLLEICQEFDKLKDEKYRNFEEIDTQIVDSTIEPIDLEEDEPTS